MNYFLWYINIFLLTSRIYINVIIGHNELLLFSKGQKMNAACRLLNFGPDFDLREFYINFQSFLFSSAFLLIPCNKSYFIQRLS